MGKDLSIKYTQLDNQNFEDFFYLLKRRGEKDKNYFVFWINHNNEHRSTRLSHKELFDWFKIDQAEFDKKFVKLSDLDEKLAG